MSLEARRRLSWQRLRFNSSVFQVGFVVVKVTVATFPATSIILCKLSQHECSIFICDQGLVQLPHLRSSFSELTASKFFLNLIRNEFKFHGYSDVNHLYRDSSNSDTTASGKVFTEDPSLSLEIHLNSARNWNINFSTGNRSEIGQTLTCTVCFFVTLLVSYRHLFLGLPIVPPYKCL